MESTHGHESINPSNRNGAEPRARLEMLLLEVAPDLHRDLLARPNATLPTAEADFTGDWLQGKDDSQAAAVRQSILDTPIPEVDAERQRFVSDLKQIATFWRRRGKTRPTRDTDSVETVRVGGT